MYIDINTIFEISEKYDAVYLSCNAKDMALSFVSLLYQELEIYSPDTIYLGKISDLNKEAFTFPNLNLLLIQDIPQIETIPLAHESSNIILLKSNVPVSEIYEQIQLQIDKVREIVTQTERRLLQAVANDIGLQGIIDIAFEVLENPISVADESLKTLVFQRGNLECTDPVWLEMANEGHISYETMSNHVIPTRDQYYFMNGSFPTIIVPESPYCRKILGRSVIHGKEAGTVGVWECARPFQCHDITITDCVLSAISAELQKNKYKTTIDEYMYINFFQDIISGRICHQKVINDRLKMLGLSFNKYFSVFVLNTQNLTFYTLNNLRAKMDILFPQSKAVISEDKVMVVYSSRAKIDPENFLADKLLSILNSGNIYIGVSRPFESLLQLKDHYQQALKASELGQYYNMDKHVINYEDCVIQHIVDLCSKENNMKDMCHGGIHQLLEFDRLHNTNYTESLHTFFENNMDIARSASVLNIHRNTMKYRMDKIQEIMQIDLSNTITLFHLFISFEFLKHVNPGIFSLNTSAIGLQ